MKEYPDCKDWTAAYLPARSDGEEITKSGFKSLEAAERYARRWYCSTCRHKVALALYWERKYGIRGYEAKKAVYNVLKPMITRKKKIIQEGCLAYDLDIDLDFEMENIFGDMSGDACGCEWMFMPTEEWNKCEDFGDIMDAVGAVKIEMEKKDEEIGRR